MNYKIGARCYINKRCLGCNHFFLGSEFKNGTGGLCRKCRIERTKRRSKIKKQKIDINELEKKMKKYRETKLTLNELKGNEEGKVLLMSWTLMNAEMIEIERAKDLVKRKKAQVYSESTIYSLNGQTRNNLLRELVLKRDGNKCFYCGGFGDTVDHITPISRGGLDILENMVCSCRTCNEIKGSAIEIPYINKDGEIMTKTHYDVIMKDENKTTNSLEDMINKVLKDKKHRWE